MKRIKLSGIAKIFVLAGILVVTLAGWRTYSYVQHDPAFCTSCHIMDSAYTKWSESVHSKITCHECHSPNLQSNLRQLWVYWTEPPDKPRHRPEVENSTCYNCHRLRGAEGDIDAGNGDPNWQHVLAESGHAEHVGKQRLQCVRCHSTSLHKFVPPSEICTTCHKHETLEKTKMVQHCTSCHKFKALKRDSLRPEREDCLECHKKMQVSTEAFPDKLPDGSDAPMHWACRECHKPHTKPKLDASDCKACHEKDLGKVKLHSIEDHDTCTDCHKPHAWKPEVPKACMECHDDKGEEHTEGNGCLDCHDS